MNVWRTTGPHAIAFGGYLFMMTVGLAYARALPHLALYAVLLAIWMWLVTRRMKDPDIVALRNECLFYAVAMNITFLAMGGAIPAIREMRYDEILLHLDLSAFGVSPNVWAQQFVTPALTEILSLCYLFFMPLLFANLVRYFFWHKPLLGTFFRGLFTVYGVGFVGYLLVPAAGPYLTYPELFSVELTGGPIAHLTQRMVEVGSNRVDVFPSLHCAVSAYILGFYWHYHRRQFWWLLLPIAGLWVSTIYLRYHYFVDVICGFALALAAISAVRPTSIRISTGVRQ